MSHQAGKMLNRTGFQGYGRERKYCDCCTNKGQKRAQDKRQWTSTVVREHLDALWDAYYEDTRRAADDFGFSPEKADSESADFATRMVASPRNRSSEPWL